MVWLSTTAAQQLYEVGESLVNLNDWYTNQGHKVQKQSKGEENRQRRHRCCMGYSKMNVTRIGSSWSPQGRPGEKPNAVLVGFWRTFQSEQ